MKAPLISVALISALMVSGCTRLGPEHQTPEVDVPLHWPALNQPSNTDQSVQTSTFEAAFLADSELQYLLRLLEENNQTLQVAALNFASSRVYRAVAEGAGEPELGLAGSVKRQRLSEDGSATRFVQFSASGTQKDALIDALAAPFTLYSTGFDASWEPDLWGKVANQLEAAKAQQALAKSEFADVRLALRTELMRRYIQIRATQAALSIQQKMKANLNEQLSIAHAWVESGLSTEQQSLTLRAQLQEIDSVIEEQLSNLHQLENQISLLLGEQPGALKAHLASQNKPFNVLPTPELALPSAVLSQRPDIRMLDAKVRAATSNIGIAEAALYPQFQLTGNMGFEALSSQALNEWSSRTWQIGPSFYLPLFNRDQLHRQVEITSITQQQAIIQYQQQVLSAWTEVDSAINKVNSSSAQLAKGKCRLALKKEQLDLAQSDFEAGLTSEVPYLSNKHQWLSAELDVIQTSLNLSLNQLSLFKALGGGDLLKAEAEKAVDEPQ